MNLRSNFPVPIKKRVRLCRHTTFGIGGPAQFWAEPGDVSELADLAAWCKKNRTRLRVIGAGSNILVADRGVSGVVARLGAPGFTVVRRAGERVIVGAGAPLARLVAFCSRQGLSGVEFLHGIPGTVGGAVAGNAGTKDAAIGDLVEFVIVMDYNGRVSKRSAADIGFSYRCSGLENVIILQVCLKLVGRDPGAIRRRIAEYAAARRAGQGAAWRSAGCCFKNPRGTSAGRLIDACGLKGRRCGSAVVSGVHANFILNKGGARASDVLMLMRCIRETVKKRFGILLEPEIKIWR
ncbi:MAG TPA: UDP-N-acetylmuramate dehydrogenase [Candidatus Omnitrophota bacterium]|nr:UDP-N-acetylmuramate dehydrogenase [Candidatus Omnitrophota bacterium]HQO38302.1 UDP-N-acetylmuramate dehydrogenase [Candidatus Omnitrophota bacterium]HQQ06184.1 UDP-N-acetylmuramate dehydrogenase [Candidatus Omnitrophota bacterium]